MPGCLPVVFVFVYGLSRSAFADIVVGGLSLKGRLPLILYTGGFVVVIGVVASYWPARYITSFPPALVLKGNYGLSPKGKKLRNSLVCLQYVVSFVLIIGALFVNRKIGICFICRSDLIKSKWLSPEPDERIEEAAGSDQTKIRRNSGCRVCFNGFAFDWRDG